MRAKDIARLRAAALERFPMDRHGIHGVSHWERVYENSQYLAKFSQADALVCELFAYLHDCCRESDGGDPRHGARAAAFAETLRGTLITLTDSQFKLLTFACEHHEKGMVSEDPTIGTCWDSDRLDLGRVGVRPNEKYLSTAKAKQKSVIEWGYKRSRGHKARLKA